MLADCRIDYQIDIVVDDIVHDVRPALGHFQNKFRRDIIADKFDARALGGDNFESHFMKLPRDLDRSWLVGILDADVSGASTLEYIGEPTMDDVNISDSSTLKKK